MSHTEDSIRGMFIGAFLGDALGAPHEFSKKLKYTGSLEHITVHNSRFQGKRELKIGQITDDSEMTLALLQSIIDNGEYDAKNTTMEYIKWANSRSEVDNKLGWSIGTNTSKLLRGYKSYRGYESRRTKYFVFDSNFDSFDMRHYANISQSNGFMMRASPLALLKTDEPIFEDVDITNPHPVCKDCNYLYVNVLRLALQKEPPKILYAFIKNNAKTEEVNNLIAEAEQNILNNTERDIVKNRGWCLNAMWCVIFMLLKFDKCNSEQYEDIMKWIIAGHPGSDTDTNACICGAIIGAISGFDSLTSIPQISDNINVLLNVNNNDEPTPRPDRYSLFKRFNKLCHKAFLVSKIV